MNREKYKLAIETGIGGGSLSIIKKGNVLDYRLGDVFGRKADNLIEALSEILNENKIGKSEIDVICYSEYPGSHTGLKIGASAAKGLQIALAADAKPENLFDSVFRHYKRRIDGKFLIVFPAGRSDIIWRIYNEKGTVVSSGQTNFRESSENPFDGEIKSDLTIFMPRTLLENPVSVYDYFDLKKNTMAVDLGENLSRYIGLE